MWIGLLAGGVLGTPAAQAEGDDHGAAEAGHESEVVLTQAQADRLSIEVAPLPRGSAAATIQRPARLALDMDRVAHVGPRLQAKVVEILRDLGDRVEAGDPLAVMNSIELGQAKSRYLTTQARLATARAAYDREQRLYDQEIGSQAEVYEARALFEGARADAVAARETLRLFGQPPEQIDTVRAGGDRPLSQFTLASPVAGVVQRRDLVVGDTVSPEQTPFHVVDTSRLWLFIDLYEQDIPLVEVGQRVDFVLDMVPGRSFGGQVDWVSREVEAATRTLKVRAQLDNPGGLLRAGMFGRAWIYTDPSATAGLIPIDAVQTVEGRQVVFVPGDEPRSYQAVPVVLGAENDAVVEVVEGLSPGQPVVTAGAFDLMSMLTARGRSAAHSH